MSHSETFTRAYMAHRRSLLNYVIGLVGGDRQLAEDVLQETMFRAWRRLERPGLDEDALRRWLYTVARRIVIDAWRARSARPLEVLDGTAESVASSGDEMVDVENRLEMLEALRRLSPGQSAVLTELYYRHRSPAETAELLGVPAGTVKSRTYYGLKALRAAFEENAQRAVG
jgi:RNA polymerase sigma-70 factor (ECF subfamily)